MLNMFSILNLFLFFVLIKSNELLQVDYKISSIHDLIRSKNVNCTDIIDYFLQRSYKYNPVLHAIINFNPNAMIEAQALDDYFYQKGKFIGRMHCIPVLVKDNIAVKGIPTTGGVNALRYSIPHTHADAIKNLINEGAIITAKTNLAEMAISSYYSETGGACRNPWDLTRSCSRSSSGSGCGVGAGLSVISIGTDTDGSIMGPASYNGVFGLRPPYGQTSLDGVIPLLETDDTIGPFAHYLEDIVLTFSVLSNNYSLYDSYLNSNVNMNTVKIRYVRNFLNNFTIPINENEAMRYKLNSEVVNAFERTVQKFQNLGASVHEFEINSKDFDGKMTELKDALRARFYDCLVNSFSFNLKAYLNDTKRFQIDTWNYVVEKLKKSSLSKFFNKTESDNANGTCGNSTYYDLKTQLADVVKTWFKVPFEVDALLFPTQTVLPEKLDDKGAGRSLGPTFTSAFTGYAALSIPADFSQPQFGAPDGLPIGMMLVVPKEKFPKMLQIARIFEEMYINNKIMPKSVPEIAKSCHLNMANKQKLSFFTLFVLSVIKVSFSI